MTRRLGKMFSRTPAAIWRNRTKSTTYSALRGKPISTQQAGPPKKKKSALPDVIGTPAQELLPISRFPETETFHLLVVVAHGGVAIRCPLQVEVYQLLQVCAHDLVRIDKDDLIEVHGEQNVEEEDLVCPNDPLFFTLLSQPRRPFVRDELVLETVFLSEVRNKFLSKMVR